MYAPQQDKSKPDRRAVLAAEQLRKQPQRTRGMPRSGLATLCAWRKSGLIRWCSGMRGFRGRRRKALFRLGASSRVPVSGWISPGSGFRLILHSRSEIAHALSAVGGISSPLRSRYSSQRSRVLSRLMWVQARVGLRTVSSSTGRPRCMQLMSVTGNWHGRYAKTHGSL